MGNRNKSLFWYGFFAKLKRGFGGLLAFVGFFTALLSYVGGSTGLLILSVGFTSVGLYFILTGSSQQFDYQRQSGSIIHRGDW